MITVQYLLSVIDQGSDTATDDEMAAIDEFNARLRADGHWVFAGGLADPATATMIDHRNGRPELSDGPYAETKEYLAGLWIIDAPDLDVALRLGADGSRACRRKIEVRPFLD